MDIGFLYLAIGLVILIIVNIVLGSLNALFVNSFDRKKFFIGLAKGLIVVLCFAATYLVGYLNPDIIAVNVNGTDVGVLTAVYLIVLAGYYYYAKQVIEKLSAIIKGDISIEQKKPDAAAANSKPPDVKSE